jgi:hypothetical protein
VTAWAKQLTVCDCKAKISESDRNQTPLVQPTINPITINELSPPVPKLRKAYFILQSTLFTYFTYIFEANLFLNYKWVLFSLKKLSSQYRNKW